MNTTISAVLAIVSGIIGLAIISVLVSPKAQTSSVLGASGGALSTVIGAAVSPVTGTGAASGGIPSSIANLFSPSNSGTSFI